MLFGLTIDKRNPHRKSYYRLHFPEPGVHPIVISKNQESLDAIKLLQSICRILSQA